MKQIPILFSTEMVNAIEDGRKTQTRRIIKPQPKNNPPKIQEIWDLKWSKGDTLWVRETFALNPEGGYFYKASYKPEGMPTMIWKPSIFMPKEACRISLLITGVRVERLKDITEQDCIAEGIEPIGDQWRNYMGGKPFDSPKHSFKSLWQKINGNWNSNPYLAVIEFTKN